MNALSLHQQYQGKTVLVTGHTGFKGSWLSIWLTRLGARVVGLSDAVHTEPSHFVVADIGSIVEDHRVDLADVESVRRVVKEAKPDFVFHLAAQALVLESYRNPLTTLATNIMGTAHLLDALRDIDWPCRVVMVTSDKCYDNVEWVWGYKETDRLGGKDPYSASKGGAELVIRTYFESFLRGSGVRLAVARAGNVIGGGDWAANRLVPDCMRAWSVDLAVSIKNPNTTRPWQLVLEPLSGYLSLGAKLSDSHLNGEAFNFGPLAENNFSVGELIEAMQHHWNDVRWEYEQQRADAVYEAGLLKLNCDKALHLLDWRPTYTFEETARATVEWYQRFYQKALSPKTIRKLSESQIDGYTESARCRDIAWAAA